MNNKPDPRIFGEQLWKKSTRSSPSGDNCVEVALVPGQGAAVRDTKDRDGGMLLFTEGEWQAFVAGTKNGEFDI